MLLLEVLEVVEGEAPNAHAHTHGPLERPNAR
jgi:hypothetical protein